MTFNHDPHMLDWQKVFGRADQKRIWPSGNTLTGEKKSVLSGVILLQNSICDGMAMKAVSSNRNPKYYSNVKGLCIAQKLYRHLSMTSAQP